MATCTCGDGNDWLLCRECLIEREGRAVAADRARIAAEIREELAAIEPLNVTHARVGAVLGRLLRVVEGG